MGKAIVSTALGCEGICVQNGEHLLVADEPAPFAQAVLRVLDDQDLAAAMGRSGRALVEREYGWASIVESLEAFFSETLAVKSPASRAGTQAPDPPFEGCWGRHSPL